MNAFQTRLLSLIALAIFCATLTWWVITLTSHQSAPLPAAAAGRSPSVEQAATLFGGQLQHQQNQDVHLFGILALQHGGGSEFNFRAQYFRGGLTLVDFRLEHVELMPRELRVETATGEERKGCSFTGRSIRSPVSIDSAVTE